MEFKTTRRGLELKFVLEDQLRLALNYLRNYGTFLETGAKFGVSESTAFNICRWVEKCLIAKNILHIFGKKTAPGW